MRSKLEERVAARLPGRFKYEPIKIPYTLECNYIPDWVDFENHVIIEAKGRLDAPTRRKMLAVKNDNPSWDICFIFQDETRKIAKNSKMTYEQWARKNGFFVISWVQLGEME